jgi:hypothetical protein
MPDNTKMEILIPAPSPFSQFCLSVREPLYPCRKKPCRQSVTLPILPIVRGKHPLSLFRRQHAWKPPKLAKVHHQLPQRPSRHSNALCLQRRRLVPGSRWLRPWRDHPLGIDDALPGHIVAVEARRRDCGVGGGQVLEADAYLAGALGCLFSRVSQSVGWDWDWDWDWVKCPWLVGDKRRGMSWCGWW